MEYADRMPSIIGSSAGKAERANRFLCQRHNFEDNTFLGKTEIGLNDYAPKIHDNIGYVVAKAENGTNYYEVPIILILGLSTGKLKTEWITIQLTKF
jgi:hypothetical protein